MRLFEDDPRTGLERLTDDADMRYATCLEAQAIWSATGEELDALRRGIAQAVDDCYIRTASARALGEYEEYFDIRYDGERDTEQRRSMVAAFFMRTPHIGDPEIRAIMAKFTQGSVYVELIGGCVHITVTIDSEDRVNTRDAFRLLRKRIPAHLDILQTVIKVIQMPDLIVPFSADAGSVFVTALPEAVRRNAFEIGACLGVETWNPDVVQTAEEVDKRFDFGDGAALGIETWDADFTEEMDETDKRFDYGLGPNVAAESSVLGLARIPERDKGYDFERDSVHIGAHGHLHASEGVPEREKRNSFERGPVAGARGGSIEICELKDLGR